jgi:hypothetical protein
MPQSATRSATQFATTCCPLEGLDLLYSAPQSQARPQQHASRVSSLRASVPLGVETQVGANEKTRTTPVDQGNRGTNQAAGPREPHRGGCTARRGRTAETGREGAKATLEE